MMTQALKVVLSSSRSTGASVSPLLVARTAPEGKEKQRLAMRKQVSFTDPVQIEFRGWCKRAGQGLVGQ